MDSLFIDEASLLKLQQKYGMVDMEETTLNSSDSSISYHTGCDSSCWGSCDGSCSGSCHGGCSGDCSGTMR